MCGGFGILYIGGGTAFKNRQGRETNCLFQEWKGIAFFLIEWRKVFAIYGPVSSGIHAAGNLKCASMRIFPLCSGPFYKEKDAIPFGHSGNSQIVSYPCRFLNAGV